MRHFFKNGVLLVLLFVANSAYAQVISTPTQNVKVIHALPQQPLDPPDVILNDQKIIFNKKPVLDEEGWLFPFEEVAAKLGDKVNVDLVSGIITIKRTRDKSIIQLN